MDGIIKKSGIGATLGGAVDFFDKAVNAGMDTAKAGLLASGAVGVAGGAAAGLIAGYLNRNNGDLISLKRRKDFLDRRINEIKNENWLSELVGIKRKLETARLTEEERTELENRYIDLINSNS